MIVMPTIAVPPTIVIVDDDEDIRLALREALECGGYSVRLAANGVEALRLVRALGSGPCVVILDMMMPIMSGEEVLRELREANRLPTLPVVVLSAGKHPHERGCWRAPLPPQTG
jgi:CheY-like chemotaxis protein